MANRRGKQKAPTRIIVLKQLEIWGGEDIRLQLAAADQTAL